MEICCSADLCIIVLISPKEYLRLILILFFYVRPTVMQYEIIIMREDWFSNILNPTPQISLEVVRLYYEAFFFLITWITDAERFFFYLISIRYLRKERERHRDIVREQSVPNFWGSLLDCEYKTYLYCFKISRTILFMYL